MMLKYVRLAANEEEKGKKSSRVGEHLEWFLFYEKEKGHIPPSEKK